MRGSSMYPECPRIAGRGSRGTYQLVSMPFRYVWPAELDLMARLAGMTLEGRWSGWRREPYTSDSTRHVSVWRKPAAPPQGSL